MFLPISMPITATALLRLWDMACSLIFGDSCQIRRWAGQKHGRTIPLTEMWLFKAKSDFFEWNARDFCVPCFACADRHRERQCPRRNNFASTQRWVVRIRPAAVRTDAAVLGEDCRVREHRPKQCREDPNQAKGMAGASMGCPTRRRHL